MPLTPAVTDLQQLKTHPAIAKLLAWNSAAVEGAGLDSADTDIWKWGRGS